MNEEQASFCSIIMCNLEISVVFYFDTGDYIAPPVLEIN